MDLEQYQALLEAQQLPQSYLNTVDKTIKPLSQKLAKLHRQKTRSIVVGINGAQGSGKSTLSAFLKLDLEQQHGLSVVVLSLDDLYLSRKARHHLANTVHPLFATRGVPGTHHVALGVNVIQQLLKAGPQRVTRIPRFDKATDDALPLEQWHLFTGRADVVILEGWCVAARPQTEEALLLPVNSLEREEDAEGIWRKAVNRQLMESYPALWQLLDFTVLLKVPDFDFVYARRALQEKKLRQQREQNKASPGPGEHIMDEAELRRFIMHYERLTRFMLGDLPGRVDEVLQVGAGLKGSEGVWLGQSVGLYLDN